MRAAGILICVVLAASAPDLATAAPVFTVPFAVMGTESGVAVYPSALYTIEGGRRTLVRTDARGRRRPMRQFDRLIRFGDREMDRGDLTSYSIAASARWLVVALHREDANQDVRTILRVVRRSGGRARTLVRCPRSSTGPLALRGSLLAHPSCDGASTIVSDLDRPARRLHLPTRGDEAAFAGARIVVFDAPAMFGGSGALGVYELADGRPVLSATDTYKQYSATSDGRVLLRRAGSCDSSPAVLLEAGTAEPRPLPGICGGWLTGDHVLGTDEAVPLAGGAARPLRLNGWLVDAVVPSGLVRLIDEQCEFTGERYTFVALRLLLADGPAAPPRCSRR